jgi:predicted membrane protein
MIGMVLYEIAQFLAIPALLVVIGLLNSYSWQYYVISISAYIAFWLLGDLIAYLVAKALSKRYTPIFKRKLEKIINLFFL